MDYDMLFNTTDFFADAEEFIQLRKKFSAIGFYADVLLTLWALFDEVGWMTLFSVIRLVFILLDGIRYLVLHDRTIAWYETLDSEVEISTNDNDYYPYVLADAMQRRLLRVLDRSP